MVVSMGDSLAVMRAGSMGTLMADSMAAPKAALMVA
jgi:hypothetical protein